MPVDTPQAPRPDALRSVPDLCEVDLYASPGHVAVPDLLIEVPHGANRAEHYHALRRRLVGDLPDDLIDFFYVNTDVGAPECAASIARTVSSATPDSTIATWLDDASALGRPRSVLVLRSVVPRTLVDCNRVIEGVGPTSPDAAHYHQTGVTKGLPDYVTDPADAATLHEVHASYIAVAQAAYDWVCGNGGHALTLHTYAPRSVRIETFDKGIAQALRAAYEPAKWRTWPQRPDVDLITEADDGTRLASQSLVDAVIRYYAKVGIEPTENASYRLHPATMGERFSRQWPGQVLCVELNRALLARPFRPFAEMTIGPTRTARMAAPLAAACLAERPR